MSPTDDLLVHAMLSVVKVLISRLGGEVEITLETLMAYIDHRIDIIELPCHGRKFVLHPPKRSTSKGGKQS